MKFQFNPGLTWNQVLLAPAVEWECNSFKQQHCKFAFWQVEANPRCWFQGDVISGRDDCHIKDEITWSSEHSFLIYNQQKDIQLSTLFCRETVGIRSRCRIVGSLRVGFLTTWGGELCSHREEKKCLIEGGRGDKCLTDTNCPWS